MVVKTETCFYTEQKIYPGHGARVVRRDGKLLVFIDIQSRRFYNNRKKAMRLRWTQAWRRANKKIKSDKTATKRLVKKPVKVFKTFSGISVEDLKAKSTATSDVRKAAAEAADRAKKAKAAPKAATAVKGGKAAAKPKTAAKPKEFTKVPKLTRQRTAAIAGRK